MPFVRFPPVVPSPTCSLSRPQASTTSLERTRLNPCSSVHWSGMAGCLANPIPNTGEALATSTSFEVGRAMVVRDLGVLRGVRRALGNAVRKRHTGSEVTYVVGHPIDCVPGDRGSTQNTSKRSINRAWYFRLYCGKLTLF